MSFIETKKILNKENKTDSVFFIEFEIYEGEWIICSSYDFDFFKTEQEAKNWIEKQRDSLPERYPLRISRYERVKL